jgi:tetratricopeptide (TPR) repeat protein
VSGFVGAPGKGNTQDEAQRLQGAVLQHLDGDDQTSAINGAAKLLVGGHYPQAIEAYTAIGAKWPDERATCEGQIGAARFFLGEFEQAIKHYEEARRLGADPAMMEDNIVEARDALKQKR